MLIFLRIVLAAALAYGVSQVNENARLHPDTGDLANAFWLAVCVIIGFLNALVWAPWFGEQISDPITGLLTSGAGIDSRNRVLQLIHWLQERHCRRLALGLCFLEGIRHPWLPAAFVMGLNHARRGSWLEKVFALEVFRFNNTQHCLTAYLALKRHGVDPGPHPHPEVNLTLLSLQKAPRPDLAPMTVPAAPATLPVKRDARIQLFEGSADSVFASAPDGGASASGPEIELGSSPERMNIEPSNHGG